MTDDSVTLKNQSCSLDFEGREIRISDISTTFIGNYDSDTSDLSYVSFRVHNEGDVSLEYDAIEISADGASQTESLYTEQSIDSGGSQFETVSTDLTVSNGNNQTTVSLLSDGSPVGSETTTVSTDG